MFLPRDRTTLSPITLTSINSGFEDRLTNGLGLARHKHEYFENVGDLSPALTVHTAEARFEDGAVPKITFRVESKNSDLLAAVKKVANDYFEGVLAERGDDNPLDIEVLYDLIKL